MGSEHNKKSECQNCGFGFRNAENYCPECGQKNHDLNIPLKHLLEESLESTLHLDSKSFRTVALLITKPGHLSREFNAGKRVNYVPPIRLYVLISFVFFFLLSILSGGHGNSQEPKKEGREAAPKSKMSVNFGGISSTELAGLTIAQADSLMSSRNIRNSGFNRYMVRKLHAIANSGSGEFSHMLMKNISYMMFVLMPLFGAWIYLLNRKKLKYFIEGLAFSIHFHCFVFLMFTGCLIISAIMKIEIFFLIGFFAAPVYMFLMFRRGFAESFGFTFLKTLVAGVLYMMSLGVLMAATVIVSMLFV